jgi:geranylgeranyl reductase family protein
MKKGVDSELSPDLLDDRKAGPMRYDVVIVGAGPAGAVLAYLLAKAGAEVLLLEKKVFPRYKACGGGLTQRALDSLPFEVDEVIEERVHRVKAFVRNECAFELNVQQPVISMVMRDRFDHYLVKKALEAGVHFQEGTTFKHLSGEVEALKVETSFGPVETRFVVGADGVNSRVARALGLQRPDNVINAVEAEVYLGDPERLAEFKHTAHFCFGLIPQGYAWLFPKRDHLSIGVLSRSMTLKNLKRNLFSYLEAVGFGSSMEVKALRPHLVPYGPGKKRPLACERGLVVGDATGFVDPITGEGISYAIREAQVASRILQEAMKDGNRKLEDYTRVLGEEIAKDLACARKFAGILYGFSNLSSRIIKAHGSRLAKLHMEVVCGRMSYRDLYRKLLHFNRVLRILLAFSK